MDLPRLLLIATGGTIAGAAPSADRTQGYRPGALPVAALVDAVPALRGLARIETEQPFAIGSQHMTGAHHLALVARIRAAQADPGLAGIVVTHGTDTMEETALLLDLTCPRDVPMVITGAMRPATAIGADGPMNLYAAAALAVDPASRGAGAVVLMNDQVFGPDRAAKAHTSRTDAFVARDGGPQASILDGRPRWHVPAAETASRRPSLRARLATLPAALPRVDIVAQHVDADPAIVPFLLSRGARGLVLAGTGHGTMSDPMRDALAAAAAAGCLIIRASRVANGPVTRNAGVDDDAGGFVPAGALSPHKARLVASLGLAAGLVRDEIGALIDAF
ncbi:MAG: asparaginase [Burkholderiales bacterium]|nr:MAG: asparaginase [Burkholderiales bacterium]